MASYAIVETGGKQYRVQVGDVLRVEKLEAEEGAEVVLDRVLMVRDGGVRLGAPYVQGASVKARVLRHGRGRKIIVFKMKRRKNYRRKRGHRQPFTELRIMGIEAPKA